MKSIISSKQTSKIDFGLADRLNKDYERNGGKLTDSVKDIEEKISEDLVLKLKKLENTVVHVPTQKQYDTLMQVYECGGWNWLDNIKPTETSYYTVDPWLKFKINTCIRILPSFWIGHLEYHIKKSYTVILDSDFYKIQNITPQDIRQINEYFDKTKPNRASKG